MRLQCYVSCNATGVLAVSFDFHSYLNLLFLISAFHFLYLSFVFVYMYAYRFSFYRFFFARNDRLIFHWTFQINIEVPIWVQCFSDKENDLDCLDKITIVNPYTATSCTKTKHATHTNLSQNNICNRFVLVTTISHRQIARCHHTKISQNDRHKNLYH